VNYSICIVMRWLQKNQAHLIVVERARLENNSKRTRLPSKTVVLSCLLATWGALWLVSVLLYSTRKAFSRTVPVDEVHDHDDLRETSPLLKSLKRPRYGTCYFQAEERPSFGYLKGDCALKQSCAFRETLLEARDACLLNSNCAGITHVPWEDRYELRDSFTFKQSFDGQLSYIKRCETPDKGFA